MRAKPSIHPVRWQPPPVDALPDPPSAMLTVVPVPGDGPEDIVRDADGNHWTGLLDGRIVRISSDGGERAVIANTGGRPLGMHVARDGRVLICDSHRGLLSLDPSSGVLTTLVASVEDSRDRRSAGCVRHRALKFCSNVTETSDGTIFFTESTSDFHFEHFLAAILEARPTGALFRLGTDGTVTTVVDQLYFANGVTVTADGSALVFAETVRRSLSKYWLTGPRIGTVTPLAVHLPGIPDNVSTGSDGRIWVAMAAPANQLAEWFMPRNPWIRKLIWRLPARLHPKIEPEVWVLQLDPDSGQVVGGVRTAHPNFGRVTGVVESDGKVWMSTIEFPAVAFYAAQRFDPSSQGGHRK